ncbi:MAG: PIG-L family deacetylase, partial [Planctomycetaceae bacterium]|nr:PIG-L family deacetylase [Planctomycetaceae bacterium]
QQQNPAAPMEKIPHLYYVDSVGGIDLFGNPLKPQFVVDVTSVYELKRKSLACHESQRNWLLRQHGMDEYLESCDRWSAVRGELIGVAHGEGFRQHMGHPYPDSDLLQRLVGGKTL